MANSLLPLRLGPHTAGTRVPRMELTEMGPSLDLEVRRSRQPPPDLEKEACRQPKLDKKKVGAAPWLLCARAVTPCWAGMARGARQAVGLPPSLLALPSRCVRLPHARACALMPSMVGSLHVPVL